jgi:hypothetical protein
MKLLILCGIVMGIALNGQCNEPKPMDLFTSPGKLKIHDYAERPSSLKLIGPNEPSGIKNSHNAQLVIYWETSDEKWGISSREILTYHPGTTLVKESEHHSFHDNIYTPLVKQVIQYDEKERPVMVESYTANQKSDGWKISYRQIQAYDQKDELILYEFYTEDWETSEFKLMWGYKAEDVKNGNGTITERTWYDYYYYEWEPDYKEIYTLNQNDVVTEIIYSNYDEDSETWEPESKHVFTLNEKGEWSEALIYLTEFENVKPIYLLGNGTQAGWNNQLGIEMLHLGDGLYGILATLRENGDLIKFISRLGHWAPQWGYGGTGDATSGTLSYRPTEGFPDPPAISISTLTKGEYIIFADTLLLTYEIFPYDDDDKNSYPWLEKKTKEEEWFLYGKITDIKWFDFSTLKPEQMTAYINASSKGNSKSSEKNDINWKEYERAFWTYHETGLPVSEEYHTWIANQWKPEYKLEWAYDHLLNNTSFKSSSYNGGKWHSEFGATKAMSYNPNGSVLSYQFASFDFSDDYFHTEGIRVFSYENFHSLAIVAIPFGAATTTGHGTYTAGANVTLTANANPGYSFLNWADVDGNIIHQESSFETVMPDGNMLVVANFATFVNTQVILAASFKLFPNPASDHITITAHDPILRVIICDITGKIVFDHDGIHSSEYRLAIPEIKPGIYLARVVTEKEIHTCKMQVVSK